MLGCWPKAHVVIEVPERGAPIMKIGRGAGAKPGRDRICADLRVGALNARAFPDNAFEVSEVMRRIFDLTGPSIRAKSWLPRMSIEIGAFMELLILVIVQGSKRSQSADWINS